jgi:hypothetical protein
MSFVSLWLIKTIYTSPFSPLLSPDLQIKKINKKVEALCNIYHQNFTDGHLTSSYCAGQYTSKYNA